jgi:hypothetical protein
MISGAVRNIKLVFVWMKFIDHPMIIIVVVMLMTVMRVLMFVVVIIVMSGNVNSSDIGSNNGGINISNSFLSIFWIFCLDNSYLIIKFNK